MVKTESVRLGGCEEEISAHHVTAPVQLVPFGEGPDQTHRCCELEDERGWLILRSRSLFPHLSLDRLKGMFYLPAAGAITRGRFRL